MYPNPLQCQVQQNYQNMEPNCIFQIPVQSVMILAFDFRHIVNITKIKNIDFDYGKSWDIVIAVNNTLTFDILQNDLTPFQVDLPEMFLTSKNIKEQTHVFKIFAYQDLNFVLFVRILNYKYTNMRMLFQQTARIKIEQPYRSDYGKNKLFMFVLQNEEKINLPLNLPVLEADQSYPPALITYSPFDTNQALQNATLTSYQNSTYQSNEVFWKSKEQIAIPYIPYMSNCKGSGQFIYLHEYIEDPNICELYSPQNTIPIRQIEFNQIPVSDNCEDIKFQCLLDEAFNDNNNYPKFYEQNQETELFFITQNPINIGTDLTTENSIKSLGLIPIVTKNMVPSSTLPKTITLEINYYQVDKYTKKIITAEMSFGSFIQESSYNSSSNFQFNFVLSFHSMSQSELAIAFALEWQVYLILCSVIGSLSICFILSYHIYFRIANIIFRRKMLKDKNSFEFTFVFLKKKLNRVRHYIKFYQPIICGVILGVSFSFLLQSLASLAMLGGFWGYSVAPCELLTTDSICETSILEILNNRTITQYIRRGRLGYTLIIIGIYGCIRISGVFFPSSTQDRINKNVDDYIQDSSGQQQKLLKTLNKLKDRDKMMVTEFYDGNIWQEKIWKRGQYIYMSIIIWMIMLIILHLSFSTFYGHNIWFFTALFKITQLFIQESLKVYMENELLTSSFNCVIATTLIVSGLGALDFYEYLFTYFVSLGISTFEKTNQVLLVHYISHYTFNYVKIFKKWVQKQFEYETPEEESSSSQNNDNFGKDENTLEDETDNQNKKMDDNSEIFLSERYEESMDTYDANFDQQSFKTYGASPIKDLKTENSQQMFSSIKKKICFADIQQVNEIIQQTQTEEDQQEEINQNESFDEFEDKFQRFLDHKISKSFMKHHNENEKQKTQEQEYKENGSQIIKVYTDFCNCSLTLLQAPFQIVQMWMFYDASQTFIRWRIRKTGLVFYLLFNVSNIPFQIIMDILLLKSVEQLHQIYISDYVNQVRQRYKNRKYNWKRDDEDDYLKMIDKEVQYIDIWCYSSQYFFCQSLFLGSSMVVINGFLTVLANKYNFLNDEYLITITLFWIIVCYLVDYFIVYIYDRISLWKVENKNKSRQQKLNKEAIDEIKLTEQQLIPTEHLTKEQQLFQATQMDTRDFNNLTAEKKFIETIEDCKQPYIQNNIFSRENIIFKQSSDQEKHIKMQQNHRLVNNAKLSKGYLEFEKKYSLLNQFPDSSQSDFDRLHHYNFSNQASQKIDQILNDQNNEFSDLKELIQKNKYIKLFFLDAIGQIKQSDLRIQNYLLELFDEKELFNISLEKKYEQIVDKYRKWDPEPHKKQQKWLNIREGIKKSVALKNKVLKLKELMPKLENNEYKNEQFKINFLNVNKKWFQKNTKLLFEDLMKGDSKNKLQKNRQLILSGFKSIYGKLKVNHLKGNQISNQEKDNSTTKVLETNRQKTSFKNTVMIIRYWLHRSRVQTLAEKCVSAFMIQGECKCCIYCKSTWAITKQIQNSNIEDLFLKFYKRECRKYRQYLNVFQIANCITKQKGKLISHGSSRRQTKKFEDFLPLDNLQDSMQMEPYTEQKSYFLSRQQKFIESWQEYFFLNAKFIYVCLNCNDIAQKAYFQIVSQFRKWSIKIHLLELNSQRDNTQKEKDEDSEGQLNNSCQINNSLLINNFALHKESYSKDEQTPKNNEQAGLQHFADSIFHLTNLQQNKYQTTATQAENQVIKEENNEDQSQADRTNQIDQELLFSSPVPQRKKSSINSILSLRGSKNSNKQVRSQSASKLNQLGVNNSQQLDNQPFIQVDIKQEGKDNQNYGQQKLEILQLETIKDQKDQIEDQKTSRSAKSIQKTHPEPSQNNLDEINFKDNNNVIDQQIQKINKNLEISQNRAFRLIQKEKQKIQQDQELDFLQVFNSQQLQKAESNTNLSEISQGTANPHKYINIFQQNQQNEDKINLNDANQLLKQQSDDSQSEVESSSDSSEEQSDKKMDGY
ncbi:hypothetical protein ABPG72_020811 [Tetrahymena utriculariae]